MITHFLSQEQVKAYCKDFAARIVGLGDKAPTVWCPIGFSGKEIFFHISEFLPNDFTKKLIIQPVVYKKPGPQQLGSVSVTPPEGGTGSENETEEELREIFETGAGALIIDSSVHSGSSMIGALGFVRGLGATYVLTYSLVIKQSSGLIPHYFGLVVGDHDRALFLLDSIPNNRLAKPKTVPKGSLRKLNETDATRNGRLNTGVPSMSKVGMGDLWYEVLAHGYQVYVIEQDKQLIGYVKYKITSSNTLFLDAIAVDLSQQGGGVGASLFRWAETAARASTCRAIELWGISGMVESYQRMGYKGKERWLNVGDEKYLHMSKPLLYHFDLKSDEFN